MESLLLPDHLRNLPGELVFIGLLDEGVQFPLTSYADADALLRNFEAIRPKDQLTLAKLVSQRLNTLLSDTHRTQALAALQKWSIATKVPFNEVVSMADAWSDASKVAGAKLEISILARLRTEGPEFGKKVAQDYSYQSKAWTFLNQSMNTANLPPVSEAFQAHEFVLEGKSVFDSKKLVKYLKTASPLQRQVFLSRFGGALSVENLETIGREISYFDEIKNLGYEAIKDLRNEWNGLKTAEHGLKQWQTQLSALEPEIAKLRAREAGTWDRASIDQQLNLGASDRVIIALTENVAAQARKTTGSVFVTMFNHIMDRLPAFARSMPEAEQEFAMRRIIERIQKASKETFLTQPEREMIFKKLHGHGAILGGTHQQMVTSIYFDLEQWGKRIASVVDRTSYNSPRLSTSAEIHAEFETAKAGASSAEAEVQKMKAHLTDMYERALGDYLKLQRPR